MREGRLNRETRETAIEFSVLLGATRGSFEAPTHVRFFDHMLEAFAVHSGLTVRGQARSLDGIAHHVVEDVALVLGGAIADALGDRCGIERFGSAFVAMDDALVRAVVDLGGRPFSRVSLPVAREQVEGLDTQLVPHFFRSLAQASRATLHVDLLSGDDAHHVIEAAFKACARAFRDAWSLRPVAEILSTKGLLA